MSSPQLTRDTPVVDVAHPFEVGLGPRLGNEADPTLLARGEPEFGTLAPGKLADLIVLNRDPLADIANTRDIDRVMQGGEWLDRTTLMTMP